MFTPWRSLIAVAQATGRGSVWRPVRLNPARPGRALTCFHLRNTAPPLHELAVPGPLEVGPAETGPALSANCGSDGRRARVRARGKRVKGRVCSVTVAAVRLKEAWLRGPEGNRRPEPPPGVHLQAVGVKTVMYWSLNKISVYGDRVHGEAVPVSSQLID